MTSTPAMPARPFPSTGVRSSNHPAGAGAQPSPSTLNRLPGEACHASAWLGLKDDPTSLTAAMAVFARRVSSRRAFLFAPAPAGIRRDQSSFLPPQAVWAPGASALGICS